LTDLQKNHSIFAEIPQDHSLKIHTLGGWVPYWTDLDVVEVFLQIWNGFSANPSNLRGKNATFP
jgi:hypothetical protein